MANLTITVDPETLKRARIRAIEEGTSVNRVLGHHLRAYAGGAPERAAEGGAPGTVAAPEPGVAPASAAAPRPEPESTPEAAAGTAERAPFVFDPGDEAARRERVESFQRLVAMAKEAGARSGGITWTREDLYDRSDRDWTDS